MEDPEECQATQKTKERPVTGSLLWWALSKLIKGLYCQIQRGQRGEKAEGDKPQSYSETQATQREPYPGGSLSPNNSLASAKFINMAIFHPLSYKKSLFLVGWWPGLELANSLWEFLYWVKDHIFSEDFPFFCNGGQRGWQEEKKKSHLIIF